MLPCFHGNALIFELYKKVFVVLLLSLSVWCDYKLCWNPQNYKHKHLLNFYPVEEDKQPDAKKMFNIPAKIYMSKPIICFICNESEVAIDDDPDPNWTKRENLSATIMSVPASSDESDTYTGELCQMTSVYLVHTPYGFDPHNLK